MRILVREGIPEGRRSGRGSRGVNTFGVGARLRVTTGDLTQLREVGAGSSYLGQEPPGEAHFGLGGAERIDRLEIRWPDGSEESFGDLPVRTTILLVKGRPPEIDTGAPGRGRP